MIQIYAKGNKNYDMNGDAILFPESCKVSAELNGTWKMDLVHPRDREGRWKNLEEECVISAPTFMGEKQLFRIREIDKTDDEVTVIALPVFLDSEDDCYLMDVRPTAKNGQEALNIMTAGSQYSGESNITTAATAYFVMRNLPDAINGSDEPTFTIRWGGEILYDNYKVIINERVGGDYGVEARYGKNMEGLDYTLDMSSVVTRIIPIAYNGYKMSGNAPWVDSDNVNKYEKKYIRKVKFEDVKMREDAQENDEENGITVCDTQAELDVALTAKCKILYAGGLDLPAVTIEVDMVELSGTKEYEDYRILERVGLGDDIRCYHRGLGITTKERVIAITWDCCRNCVDKLTLGESQYDYFENTSSSLDSIESILGNVSGAIADNGSIIAGKIKGFLDATKTQLRLQNGVAQKQIVRAILFEDLDPKSELYGAMSLGTLGLQIAKKRTADGRDWDWTTALTANGLIANIIVAGILSDKRGLNYWNLDTGEFSLSATGFTIDGQTADDYFKDNWTQKEVFDKLTNNGATMGIYMSGGKLYLNAQYMQIGKISSKNGKVYFDLDNNELACSRLVSPEKGDSLQTVVDVGYPEGKAPADYTGSLMRVYSQGYSEKAVNIYVNAMGIGNMSSSTEMKITASGDLSSGNGISYIDLYRGRATLAANFLSNSNTYGHSKIELLTNTGVVGGSVEIGPYLKVLGDMRVSGTMTAIGTKSRAVETQNYGERLLYCYEMPSPMFGDIGEGITDENGECYIYIDHIFNETVSSNIEYQVFLQEEGEGKLWIEVKEDNYFLVRGTKNLKFSWEVKVSQKSYEYERLEEFTMERLLGTADLEVEHVDQIWIEEVEREENEQEEMWSKIVQEIDQNEKEQEESWYEIAKKLCSD